MMNNNKNQLEVLKSTAGNGSGFVPKRCSENWIKFNTPELYESIINYTKLEDVDFRTRLIMFHNEYETIPLCIECKTHKIKLKEMYKHSNFCSRSCAIKNIATQEKTKNTCDEKYGKRFNVERKEKYDLGEHHTQNNITNIEDINKKEFIITLIKNGGWVAVAEHFNLTTNSHTSTSNFLKKYCNITLTDHTRPKSIPEKMVIDFVKENCQYNVQTNCKNIIAPYELDIYIPELKLAIEFDGLYRHSYNSKETVFCKNYHKMKTDMCENLGIKLIHIFESDWVNKEPIIKSMIRNSIKASKHRIYARKCEIRKVGHRETKDFLNSNHIQGAIMSFDNSVGLYHDGKLCSIMVMGKSRFAKDEYELLRFANIIDTNVVGGFSKLLKNVSKENKNIISYGNRRWCCIHDNVYEKNGFEFLGVTVPNYFYFKNREYELYSRNKFQKHKLKNMLEKFDEDMTESENMFSNGYRRIWDCGNIKYSLTNQ